MTATGKVAAPLIRRMLGGEGGRPLGELRPTLGKVLATCGVVGLAFLPGEHPIRYLPQLLLLVPLSPILNHHNLPQLFWSDKPWHGVNLYGGLVLFSFYGIVLYATWSLCRAVLLKRPVRAPNPTDGSDAATPGEGEGRETE